jgi:HAD superfamily hydrolase (TIGR01509 family)
MINWEKYEAIVFDLDGTLADTMPLHLEACQLVCREKGFDFPEDFFYQEAGKPTITVFRDLMQKLNLPYDGEELGQAKENKVLELIPKVGFVPEVKKIFDQFKGKKKFAIGSGGQRHTVDLTLEVLGISNEFDAIVSSDDVSEHKPDPITFLKAAELMSIKPSKCIVLEDGDPGIQAAIAAGMDYLDVRTII